MSSQAHWESELDKKTVLHLNPKSHVTIKRDVHNVYIRADAAAFANAFQSTLMDSSKRFGFIHIMRKQANIDRPFTKGERFQGRYSVEDALKLVDHQHDIVRLFEDHFTSDYGIISELEVHPPPGGEYRIAYQYIEGSPIAGSSTWIIQQDQVEKDLCRFTQIFEYQELQISFALFFGTLGLKLHDQVVWSQVKQSADSIGAKVVRTDIPDDYKI